MDRLGDRVHPMIEILYAKKDVVFQGDSACIHRVATLQSCFEEHDDELQHLLWPAHSLALNTIEPLWSVFRLVLGTVSHFQQTVHKTCRSPSQEGLGLN